MTSPLLTVDNILSDIRAGMEIVCPEVDFSNASIESIIQLLDSVPDGFMGQYYESWPKVEVKSGVRKTRWLSKVPDNTVKNLLSRSYRKYDLPSHSAVSSYTEGIGISYSASKLTNMHCIAALDIKDFYYSITRRMVEKYYYTNKSFMPFSIRESDSAIEEFSVLLSKYLGMIFTARDPRPENIRRDEPVLLQGSPHAGAISNWILYELDDTLTGLARSHEMVYTRYSDNFYFGSETGMISPEFIDQVISEVENYSIDGEHNFVIKRQKTKIMPYYTHQRVLGIVVNKKMNISSSVESALNASISSLSKTSNEFIRDAIMQLRGELERNPRDISAKAKRISSDKRKIKGMISFIGAFNREKYDKYSRYVELIESRYMMANQIVRERYSTVYPQLNPFIYPANVSLISARYSNDRTIGDERYGATRDRFIYHRRNPVRGITFIRRHNGDQNAFNSDIDKFTTSFPGGVIGIRSEIGGAGCDLYSFPLPTKARYLLLADDIIMQSARLNLVKFKNTLQDVVFDITSNELILSLGVLKGMVIPRSCMVYNSENPRGHIPFEDSNMEIRGMVDGDQVGVVNRLDDITTYIDNLWKVRKSFIRGEAFIR